MKNGELPGLFIKQIRSCAPSNYLVPVMKIITSLIVLFSFFCLRASAQGRTQTLIISNLANKTGSLYIGWYAAAEGFRKPDKAVFQKIAAVGGRESVPVSFENVPPGTYAIAVFFDVNGNGKMDTNFLGIPKEKYGFSNNIYPMMRAATFKESSFIVTDKEGNISIRLKG